MSNDTFVEIDLDINGAQLAPKNDKVALIDADTLAYTTCLGTEVEEIVYDDVTSEMISCFTIDLDEALERAKARIDTILGLTGCKEAELHFTGGRENFRYTLYPEYKANRKGMRTPEGLGDLKRLLIEHYKGAIHTKWEADDMVVHLKAINPDKYILVAIDKDVLYATPGKHFNYFKADYYVKGTHVKKDMEFIDISERDSVVWPYLQCINGDTSDNIKGPSRIGPKTMLKFFGVTLSKEEKATIKDLHHILQFIPSELTEKELWDCVVAAYESKGLTEADAMFNMNLVNMQLLKNIDGELRIVLWNKGDIDD